MLAAGETTVTRAISARIRKTRRDVRAGALGLVPVNERGRLQRDRSAGGCHALQQQHEWRRDEAQEPEPPELVARLRGGERLTVGRRPS